MTHYFFDKKKWREHCSMCHNVNKSMPVREATIGVSANTIIPCKEFKGCIDNFKHHINGEDTELFFPERKRTSSIYKLDLFPIKSKKKKNFHKEIGLSRTDEISNDILNTIKKSYTGQIISINGKDIKVTKHMKQVAVWKLNLRKINKRCKCK